MKNDDNAQRAVGVVEEVLPDSLFRVSITPESPTDSEGASEVPAEKTVVLAYLAGKMRLHHIRVLVGDKVEMNLDPYGGRARIVRRLT